MKEKIKNLIKNNIYNIFIITIIVAYFTYITNEGKSILFFITTIPFFLAIIWFFTRDKEIKEFKINLNQKFPFFGKMLAVILKIFVFLILLFSIFIITMQIIDTIEKEQSIKKLDTQYEKLFD